MSELTELGFIRDLAIVLIVAAATTVIAHRTRQPVVLGYLLAGVIVGPFLLPALNVPFSLVTDIATISALAQLGIIFLMFSLGLEFNLRRLRAMGTTAMLVAVAEVAFLIWLGYLLGQSFGWSHLDSLFLGAILSISSTVVTVKVLEERGETSESYAQLLVGILLVQDVAAVVIITLLPTSVAGFLQFGELGAVLLQLGLFVVVALVLGLLLVPRLIDFVARLAHEEVLTVTALGLCLAGALLAAGLGLSVALGSFILGAVVAEADRARDVRRSFSPIRNMFTAVFFVSVGMLVDAATISTYAIPILVAAAVMVLGKLAIVSITAFLLGAPGRSALKAGFGLGNIGEFSFVIASRGGQLGATSAVLFPITVGIAAVTTLLTPFLLRASGSVASGLSRMTPPPLRMTLAGYQKWVASLRAGEPDATRQRIQALTTRLGINLAILFVILVTAGVATRILLAGVTFGPIAGPASLLLIWILGGALCLPSAAIVVQSVRELFSLHAGRAPGVLQAGMVVMTSVFLFAVLALLLGPLWPALPPLPVALFAITSMAVVAAAAWRYVSRLHRHWEEALQRVLGSAPGAEELYALLRDYPVELSIERLRVPRQSPAAYRTVSELDLKGVTGATIVSIERDAGPVHHVGPQTVLAPDDVLVLVGEPAQIERARGWLSREVRAARAALRVRELAILPGSPLAGKSLAESQLRSRTGVTLLALRRAGSLLPNPPPGTLMREEDVIVVLGEEDAIALAAVLAKGGAGDKNA